MHRVVITGIGIFGPWGRSHEAFWRIIAGQTPIFQRVTTNIAPLPPRLGGEIPGFTYEKQDPMFNQANKYCQLTIIAAEDALKDAGLVIGKASYDIAIIGSTAIGHPTINQFGDMLSPLKSQYIYYHAPIGMLCIRNRIKGFPLTVTSGEASGAHAVGLGYHFIRSGKYRAAIVGGADILSRTLYFHYASLNEIYQQADAEEQCRPFDRKRNGLICAEGAAFLVLEEMEHARQRKAKIYGEICGFGSAHDCDGSMFLNPDGPGIALSMETALKDAGLTPEEVDYIGAAANGSKLIDGAEATAIQRVFQGKSPWVSSIKGIIGESFSGGCILNIVSLLQSMENRVLIPTVATDEPEFALNLVAQLTEQAGITTCLSNAVSYGGNYATLIIKRFEG